MESLASPPTSPEVVYIEGIPVSGFPDVSSFFGRLAEEIEKPGQSVLYYLNVHVANEATRRPTLKRILKQGSLVYCDGAGIVLASKIQGQPLPTRLTAADWFIDMLAMLAEGGHKVFLLGGEPGVAQQAMENVEKHLPGHTVVGMHHGYILDDPALEDAVIAQINAAQPDVLIVGFGTPLQEFWIDRNRDRLNVSVVYAIGAVMDYLAGKVSRCPTWLGRAGLEWLYRLSVEPVRLFNRYVIGNPWFLGRIFYSQMRHSLTLNLPKPLTPAGQR
jgi:N-acetylglucosaminyldiphosphoundecaprenol N-acetyl-beta-D-mannosaminyltransferase